MIRLELKISTDINRQAAKLSALSSQKIDEYLTGEEILLCDQSGIMEQAKKTNKQTKNN